MGELTSVAQLKAGATTLLFLSLPLSFSAASARSIAEEPELT